MSEKNNHKKDYRKSLIEKMKQEIQALSSELESLSKEKELTEEENRSLKNKVVSLEEHLKSFQQAYKTLKDDREKFLENARREIRENIKGQHYVKALMFWLRELLAAVSYYEKTMERYPRQWGTILTLPRKKEEKSKKQKKNPEVERLTEEVGEPEEVEIWEVIIFTNGRKETCVIIPDLIPQKDDFKIGMEVEILGGFIMSLNSPSEMGGIAYVKELLPLSDKNKELEVENAVVNVSGGFDQAVPAIIAPDLYGKVKLGDRVFMSGPVITMILPKEENIGELRLEEVPDITYEQIGGLSKQIEKLQKDIEYPFLYPDTFKEHKLEPPKGILLFGPPGCGKTLIAKAVANSIVKQAAKLNKKDAKAYFLHIDGPSILNKFVGQSEQNIREIFEQARRKAKEGMPVMIFFDEMEALFKIRGTDPSTGVHDTIVAQFLAMMDGMTQTKNIIVIGASNRQELIDPALLRPGRFDTKIEIPRPDLAGVFEIFKIYLDSDLPIDSRYSLVETYDSPNRFRTLAPESYKEIEEELRPIREKYGIDIKPKEKKEKIEDSDGLWEIDQWHFRSKEDIIFYFIYRAVESLCLRLDRSISWTSRTTGEIVGVDSRFLEITYEKGGKEIFHYRDFLSGALIKGIVDKAKKRSAVRSIETKRARHGLMLSDIWIAIEEIKNEEKEVNKGLGNTTINPNEWATTVGKKGERVINVRPIIEKRREQEKIEEVQTSGNYL